MNPSVYEQAVDELAKYLTRETRTTYTHNEVLETFDIYVVHDDMLIAAQDGTVCVWTSASGWREPDQINAKDA